jgi:RNA polymerase sigma-70 factor (ECF subfamily)
MHRPFSLKNDGGRAVGPVSENRALPTHRADLPAFYNEWFENVLKWVRALGGRDSELEDIAQEVFLVVRKRIDTFDGRNPAGWLYQITRRKVRDFRQLAWIKKVFTRDHVDTVDDLPSDGEGPAAELERKQKQRILHLILTKMDEDRRATFVLFEIDGVSGEDIARLQGVPVNTVWSRLHKARKEFLALAARYHKVQEHLAARRTRAGKAKP